MFLHLYHLSTRVRVSVVCLLGYSVKFLTVRVAKRFESYHVKQSWRILSMILSSWSLFFHSTLWFCGFRLSNSSCLKIMEYLGEFRVPLSPGKCCSVDCCNQLIKPLHLGQFTWRNSFLNRFRGKHPLCLTFYTFSIGQE